jgi:hypothetical protein
MAKNATKIKAGIQALAHKPHELISGTVVPGSVDVTAYTVSVQPSNDDAPIEGVMLGTITNDANGMLLVPKDGSHVVIGCVDGPGEWTLLRAGVIDKALITIGSIKYEMDDTQVCISNGNTVFSVGTNALKIRTAGESLFQLLNDLLSAISILTVTTSTGPSSVPINAATFTTLQSRLNNLLSA